jgi:glycerol 2-dehydrogenase (NADP+)
MALRRCWMGEPGGGERAYAMVKKALLVGYRHFDTAAGYRASCPRVRG